MKLAHRVQGRALMAKKKNGRRSRGGGEVVDITPLLLKEIRDGFRDLSGRVDGLSGRVDGLTERVDGLTERMDRVERELVMLRQDLVQRVSALESAVFPPQH